MRIPDLRNYYLLGSTVEGLLVLCQKGTATELVQLLNPLTGQLTDLPLDSAGIAEDSTVAVLYDSNTLAVAKPGDERWTRFTMDYYTYGSHAVMASVLPYAGRLYCITHNKILVVEAAAEQQRPRLEAVALGRYELELMAGRRFTDCWMYPVYDDEGNLILVHRDTREAGYSSEKYTTYPGKIGHG
ncbi:hypothetical protein HU200_051663 [Digitaria exilis]|uniref:KIB1-4 beta-propeller domain-containing protein n=1 Tax=Digitaria exilis TaxID=1010633 RepID=A0A835AQC7_9POAL|nr:hypothetical protein HU200_051663 [Digitaria exilis]